jgi:hypothetical protein
MAIDKDNKLYETLNLFYELLEDFILSLTIPGAKD